MIDKKKVFLNYLVLSFLIILFFYLMYIFSRNLYFYLNWKGEKETLDEQILIENQKQDFLKNQKTILLDKDGGEKKLLEKFQLQRPGEKTIEIMRE